MLTDEHMSILEELVPKFQSAKSNMWNKIIAEAADSIRDHWTDDIQFNRDTVANVCGLSANWAILRNF